METETLGVSQLKRLLGRGGMGSVYLAHDPRLARDVALKVLSPELERGSRVQGRRLLERFLDVWGDADWELEIVEDARSRLAS